MSQLNSQQDQLLQQLINSQQPNRANPVPIASNLAAIFGGIGGTTTAQQAFDTIAQNNLANAEFQRQNDELRTQLLKSKIGLISGVQESRGRGKLQDAQAFQARQSGEKTAAEIPFAGRVAKAGALETEGRATVAQASARNADKLSDAQVLVQTSLAAFHKANAKLSTAKAGTAGRRAEAEAQLAEAQAVKALVDAKMAPDVTAARLMLAKAQTAAVQQETVRSKALTPIAVQQGQAGIDQTRAQTAGLVGSESRAQAAAPLQLQQGQAGIDQTRAQTAGLVGSESRAQGLAPSQLSISQTEAEERKAASEFKLDLLKNQLMESNINLEFLRPSQEDLAAVRKLDIKKGKQSILESKQRISVSVAGLKESFARLNMDKKKNNALIAQYRASTTGQRAMNAGIPIRRQAEIALLNSQIEESKQKIKTTADAADSIALKRIVEANQLRINTIIQEGMMESVRGTKVGTPERRRALRAMSENTIAEPENKLQEFFRTTTTGQMAEAGVLSELEMDNVESAFEEFGDIGGLVVSEMGHPFAEMVADEVAAGGNTEVDPNNASKETLTKRAAIRVAQKVRVQFGNLDLQSRVDHAHGIGSYRKTIERIHVALGGVPRLGFDLREVILKDIRRKNLIQTQGIENVPFKATLPR